MFIWGGPPPHERVALGGVERVDAPIVNDPPVTSTRPRPAGLPVRRLRYSTTHVPPTQMRPLPHRTSQAPQLKLSVWSVRQRPPQLVVPVPHDARHDPAEHTCPAGHTVPHAPQLSRSVAVSRHTPSQLVVPTPHDPAHLPPEHNWPKAQLAPHAPQLALSFARSRHDPEQLVEPWKQDALHMPTEHTWPPAQTLPQVPQLELSDWRSRQMPEQAVRPAGQAQLPATQAVPPVQARAHMPQLVLSVWRSRQTPEHMVWPVEQMVRHTPAEQSCPAAQTRPQPPQWLLSTCVLRQAPEQLLVPASQDTRQVPLEHTWPAAQGAPQPPQWLRSMVRFTSQPSSALLLQLPKPAAQAPMVHAPAAQPAVPFGMEHSRPQTPQFAASVEVVVSQPLAGLLSQLPKPSRQLESTHALPVHPATAFGKRHWLPQVRQWLGSLVRSRQLLPQSTWPVGHWTWQNAARAPPSGVVPPSAGPPADARTQRSPEVIAHAVPQPPQFSSVVSGTHTPLQTVRSGPVHPALIAPSAVTSIERSSYITSTDAPPSERPASSPNDRHPWIITNSPIETRFMATLRNSDR